MSCQPFKKIDPIRLSAAISEQVESHLAKLKTILSERSKKKTPEQFEQWVADKFSEGLTIPIKKQEQANE
jgi:hypothetical protein